jgi:hypothetical protein
MQIIVIIKIFSNYFLIILIITISSLIILLYPLDIVFYHLYPTQQLIEIVHFEHTSIFLGIGDCKLPTDKKNHVFLSTIISYNPRHNGAY